MAGEGGAVNQEPTREPSREASRISRRGFIAGGTVAGAGAALLGVRPTNAETSTPVPSPKPPEKPTVIPPTSTVDPLATPKAELASAQATAQSVNTRVEMEQERAGAQATAAAAQERINRLRGTPPPEPTPNSTATQTAKVFGQETRIAASNAQATAAAPKPTPNAAERAEGTAVALKTQVVIEEKATAAMTEAAEAQRKIDTARREGAAVVEKARKDEEDRIRKEERDKNILPVVGVTPVEAGVTAGVSILAGGAIVDQLKGKGAVRKAIGGGITTIAKKIPLLKKLFGP